MSRFALIDYALCITSGSKAARCRRCADVCASDAIVMAEGKPIALKEECIACDACLGVCPTRAVKSDGFEPVKAVYDYLQNRDEKIDCTSALGCIAAFGSELLSVAALLKNSDVAVELGGCDGCEFGEANKRLILSQIEEANVFLDAVGSPQSLCAVFDPDAKPLSAIEIDDVASRRDFLRSFGLRGALKTAHTVKMQSMEPPERIEAIVENMDYDAVAKKALPVARELLLKALEGLEFSNAHDKLELSFATNKIINESCTNCALCVNLCPSGALSYPRLKNEIFFDAKHCLRCRLCEDVCETHSISSVPFELSDFWAQKPKSLALFKAKRCDGCGLVFTPLAEESQCQRCSVEYDDALDLLGL